MTVQPEILVHGGAGPVSRERLAPADDLLAREILAAALAAGGEVLAAEGSALDAVEAAVRLLEAHELLNAGVGSVLNRAGEVELDACIMEGTGRRVGAVAACRRTAHPISLARAILDDGEHVLLAADGADAFARARGVEAIDPAALITARRRRQLERAEARGRVVLDHDESARGTVGAVARDARGGLAAATSTGGMVLQRPGRVGDSGLPGAGTWADDRTCALSATGDGEVFIRAAFAHAVHAAIELTDSSLTGACARALTDVGQLGGQGGCIALAASGEAALRFTTEGMFRGRLRPGATPQVALYADEGPGGPLGR